MSIVKLILTIETSQQGNVSLKSFDIERVDRMPSGGVVRQPAPVISADNAVSAFLSRVMPNHNETSVLRMLIEARRNGTQVYRRQILSALGLDQLLQWNGVSAWLTRNWRTVTGNEHADITAIRYDQSEDDYEITFARGISEEVISGLAEGLGMN